MEKQALKNYFQDSTWIKVKTGVNTGTGGYIWASIYAFINDLNRLASILKIVGIRVEIKMVVEVEATLKANSGVEI